MMRGITIEMIVRGMRDAMETDSPDVRKLLLCVGADALESLSKEFEIVNRQHGQMARVLADDIAILPENIEGGLEIKTSYERTIENDKPS